LGGLHLITLVMKISERSRPACCRAASRSLPPLPTKGFPERSSSRPGASPTSINLAGAGPAPGTARVLPCQRGQRRQAEIASSRRRRDSWFMERESASRIFLNFLFHFSGYVIIGDKGLDKVALREFPLVSGFADYLLFI